MKTPVLSTWYRAGKGLDVEHDLRVLQYTAVRHTQEAVLKKWQAATVGHYHARRCIKIAMSVWVSDTAALSHQYKCLVAKTVAAKAAALRDIFFSAWKQPVNVRILGERRRFSRALRFIRQVGLALRAPLPRGVDSRHLELSTALCSNVYRSDHAKPPLPGPAPLFPPPLSPLVAAPAAQWRETTFYIRKARTSKNMLEVAQPLHLLQLQLAEMKTTRQLLSSQWNRTRRMARYAHVLNTHVMQVLGATSPLPSPRSSLSSSGPNTPRLQSAPPISTSARHQNQSWARMGVQRLAIPAAARTLPAAAASRGSSTVVILSDPSDDSESMVEVTTPTASLENTPRSIGSGPLDDARLRQVAFADNFPVWVDGADAGVDRLAMHSMMQCSRAIVKWQEEVLCGRMARAVRPLIVFFSKRQSLAALRAAMYAWQRAAPQYISLPDFRALEQKRFRRCIAQLRLYALEWLALTARRRRNERVVTRSRGAAATRRVGSFIGIWMGVAQRTRSLRVRARNRAAGTQLWAAGAWRENVRCVGALRRVAARWRHRLSGSALEAWQVLTWVRRRHANAVSRVQRRAAYQLLLRTLQCWREVVAQVSRLRRLRGNVLRRSRASSCSAAFSGWATRSLAQALQAKCVHRVVRRRVGNLVAAGLSAWRMSAQERRARTRLHQKVAARLGLQMVHRLKASALWSVRERVRQRRALRRAVTRMASRGLAHAWASWVDSREMLRRFASVSARSRRSLGRRAWLAWEAGLQESLQHELITRKVLCRFNLKVGLIRAAALQGWRSWAEQALWAKRIVGKLQFRCRALAYRTSLVAWHDAAAAARKLRKAGARLVMRGLLAAINAWLDHVSLRRRLRVVVGRVRGRWAAGATWAGWQAWREHHEAGTRYRRIASRALRKWSLTLAAAAWGCWLNGRQARLRVRCILVRVCARWRAQVCVAVGWNRHLSLAASASRLLRAMTCRDGVCRVFCIDGVMLTALCGRC